jgi:hypothetical protein
MQVSIDLSGALIVPPVTFGKTITWMITETPEIEIDEYKFKLICKNISKDNRCVVKIQSIDKDGNVINFTAYQSQSELGTWRLRIPGPNGYAKPGNYVTGTFIHLELQKFIFEKLHSLKQEPELYKMSSDIDTQSLLEYANDKNTKGSRKSEICEPDTETKFKKASYFCAFNLGYTFFFFFLQ